ncbi:MAG: hypothetical protein C4617_02785 [Candidatus Liberibacter europaeus]|uniref:Solute-binding protein family 5 domain-containing protein n=1 Tax=Candidatus Liberibacter europaeus TaxID=744859 RepID=A0A2T4VY95_9HYPH|nr:hypothetical protein [Candidatus Liberibacter europaeus]PTL86748.1 MAG: hypothetical protein C4617_02785 [Candidatus Liberibacter europaeus]
MDDSEKIYDFHLHRGVKWHSNKHFRPSRELNADDVIFSFMRQKDPNPFSLIYIIYLKD